MHQDTKAKFDAILAAAKAKVTVQTTKTFAPIPETKKDEVREFTNLSDMETAAKNGETISLLNMANLVNADKPKQVFKPLVSDIFPELSTTTFADLIPAIAPEPQKQALKIVDYSDRAFAVIGDTKPIKDTLRLLGGSFNSRLTCGCGWIFSKKHLNEVKTKLGL